MYQIVSHPDRIIADLGLAWRTNVAGGFLRASLNGRWTVTFLRRLVSLTVGRRDHAVARARCYGLKREYFDEAAKQIGTDASNDFMHGKLHVALQKLLAADIKNHKLRHTRFRSRNCRCI